MTDFDPTPPRTSVAGATAAAIAAAVLVALGSTSAFVLAASGAGILSLGGFSGRRILVTAGALLGFLAVLVATLAPGGVLPSVLAAGCLFVAWDVADHAISLGEHVGTGRTRHAEQLHAVSAVAVATLAATASYGVFRLGAGQRPIGALVLMLVGAIVIAFSVRTD